MHFPSIKLALATAVATSLSANAVLVPRQSGGGGSSSASGFVSPASNGGRMLTYIPNQRTSLGEPINVIIANTSDAYILTPTGFLDWASSVQLIPNACILRENLGGAQQADLGDGNGRKNQSDVLRYSYWTDNTCTETIQGGNHARYWRQNGSRADTGAWFLAASVEMPLAQSHDIVDNGYDLGRDWIVGNATQSNGTLSTRGSVFQATSSNAPLLQSVSVSDINHGIAVDGNVAVLTVRLIKNGTAPSSPSSSSGSNPGGSGTQASGATLTLGEARSTVWAAAGLALLGGLSLGLSWS